MIIAKIAWKEDNYFLCFRQAENFKENVLA